LREPFALWRLGQRAVQQGEVLVGDRLGSGLRAERHYAGGPPDFYELGEPAKPFDLADPPAKS
jgi:hypothetical protein